MHKVLEYVPECCKVARVLQPAQNFDHHRVPGTRVRTSTTYVTCIAIRTIWYSYTRVLEYFLLIILIIIKGERTRVEKQMLGGGLRALYR